MTHSHVLLIEDEALIAMFVESILLDMGDYTVEMVTDMAEGLSAASTGDFSFAILDIDLQGVVSYPIADMLIERGIPFAFSTGYGCSTLPSEYAHIQLLQKPFDASDLKAVVAKLTGDA